MNRPFRSAALLLALIGAAASLPSAAQAPLKKPASALKEPLVGQVMVKLRDATAAERVQKLGASRVAALSKSAGVALETVRPMSGDATVMRLPEAMPLSQAQAVIDRLRADPAVEWAAPDLPVRRLQTQVPPDQGYATLQWNLFNPATPFVTTTVGGGSKTFTPTGGANLPAAWARSVGSANVVVAVIDTGVVGSHRDLRDRLLPGYDFVSSGALGIPGAFVANDGDGRDADASDPGDWVSSDDKQNYAICRLPGETAPYRTEPSSWHGTHMAGIIAAQWGNDVNASTGVIRNGTRIAGIGPALKILPVRALGKCGGTSSDVIDAMRWAAGLPASSTGQTWAALGIPANANPAKVINLSLGGQGVACNDGSTYAQVVADVTAAGATIVAASGNEGAVGVLSPANCPGVIAVTAHVINGDNADYSNVGPEIAISAPGGGAPTVPDPNLGLLQTDNAYVIWSTGLAGATTPDSFGAPPNSQLTGDALVGLTGTSPATPHVSAAVALMRSVNPNLTAANIRGFLQGTARQHPAGGYCLTSGLGLCGAGLLDVGAAMTAVLPVAPAVPPQAPPLPPEPVPPPSGGGGGSLPLWPVLLMFALGLAREVRRRSA